MVAATPLRQQRLVANLGARVVRREDNGRTYLVAPASLIVPGVLNGSDGAGYYPPEENDRSAASWDGMPIVVYHPTRNGVPVAAQDPAHKDWVWQESGIGALRNSRSKGRLTSEAWFDEEYTRDYDRRLSPEYQILPKLNAGLPIELSTGLHVDRDDTPGVCPRTGRAYQWVARNYRPDHLAVLPDQRGACSVDDGCGVVVNSNPEGCNQYKDCSGGGDGGGPSSPKAGFDAVIKRIDANVHDPDIVRSIEAVIADISSRPPGEVKALAKEIGIYGMKSKSAAVSEIKSRLESRWENGLNTKFHPLKNNHRLLDSDRASTLLTKVVESVKELQVANAGKFGNPQCGDSGKFMPHGSGTGKGPVHWAVKAGAADLQASAEEGFEDDDGTSEDEDMTRNADDGDGQWVTLPNGVHIQVKDGEIVKGPKIGKERGSKGSPKGKSQKDEDLPDVQFDRETDEADLPEVQFDKDTDKADRQRERAAYELTKPLTRRERSQHGPSRIRNQDHSGSGSDQAVTNGGEDMASTMTAEVRKGLVDKIVANCKCQGGKDREVINGLSDAALLQLNAFAKGPEEEDDEDDEDEGEKTYGKKKGKVPPQFMKNQDRQLVTNSAARVLSDEEWLKTAPPGIASAVTNALKIERSARAGLIAKLVANKSDEQKAKYSALLGNKSLDELEMLVDLLPPVQNSGGFFDGDGNLAPVFLGAGGGFEERPASSYTSNLEAPPLVPVVNWEEQAVAEERAARRQKLAI